MTKIPVFTRYASTGIITILSFISTSSLLCSDQNPKKIQKIIGVIFILFLAAIMSHCSPSGNGTNTDTCSTLACKTSKYNLFVADIDGSDVEVIKTSSYQDMSHPRVFGDKQWVSYTTYHKTNSSGCATYDQGYVDTEIRAIRINGTGDKNIMGPSSGALTSNNFWVHGSNDMTYLSGLPGQTKIYRLTVDANMQVTSGPAEITVPSTILPIDPAAHYGTNKIVYPGIYDDVSVPGTNLVRGIWIMNLSDSGSLVALSLGRDHAGNTLYDNDIEENDPKISPNGDKVVFMRRAKNSGSNGFGWHLFVVPIAIPLNETDISYSHLGSDLLKHDTLPEWIDNDTIIFSMIDVKPDASFTRNLYTMKADGSSRTQVSLPAGYYYKDAYPFSDLSGKQRMIISVEKSTAACTP